MTRTFTQRLVLALNQSSKGTVYLRIEHDLSQDLSDLSITVPDYLTEDSANGFSKRGVHQWDWDGQNGSPWIRFLVDVSQTNTGNYKFVDTGSWAVVTFPPVSASWKFSGSTIRRDMTYEVEGDGITSADGSLTYLGSHDEHQFTAGDQLFRLSVPRAASLTSSRKSIAESLSHVSRNLEVGGRDDEVVVISAPSGVNWGWGGLQTGSNGFWALDSARVSDPNNTWVHEYVHTRQDWNRHKSTEWLIEGTTNYYAALYTYYQGRTSFDSFRRHLTTSRHSQSKLFDPSAWTSSNAHYTKGRRVTAALDAKIRAATNRQHTFEDVFRRMNDLKDPLTHQRFEQIVVDVAGDALRGWLQRYVSGTQQPEVPDDERLFVPAEGVDEPVEVGPPEEPESPEEPEPTETCPVCETDVPTSERYCPTCGTSLFKQCPVCSHDVQDQEYCPECGTNLIEECNVCGHRRHDDETYCEQCGTEF